MLGLGLLKPPQVPQDKGEVARGWSGCRGARRSAGVGALGAVGVAVAVLGQRVAALSASRVSQGGGLGGPAGVDGGTDDPLGNMSAGRGAALDGVHEVVEYFDIPVSASGAAAGRW